MLLLSTVLWAHVPHDIVRDLATPPDLDPARPWLLVMDLGFRRGLFRSDDGGQTWTPTAADCLVDVVSDAAGTSDGRLALIGEGRYWWTEDVSTWNEVAIPFTVVDRAFAGGDLLFFGTEDGVWHGATGDTPVQSLAGTAFVGVHAAVGGAVAVAEDGTLYHFDGATWTAVTPPTPGAVARAATHDGAALYAGYDDGTVSRWDGSAWSSCGVTPLVDDNPAHFEVVQLATDGTTLLVAHADSGPAASTDGCATWTDVAAPQSIEWEDDGSPSVTVTEDAIVHLAVAGDVWSLGGYAGVWRAEAGEWDRAPLRGADAARAFGFSSDFSTDGAALAAGYGCGVYGTEDAGETWTCPGQGYSASSIPDLTVAGDAVGLVPAFALMDRDPHISEDGGASWWRLSTPFSRVEELEAGPDGRLWAADFDDPSDLFPGDVAWSDDDGSNWNAVSGFPPSIGNRTVRGVIDAGDDVVAWTDSRVYRSTDAAGSFSTVFTDPPGGIAAVAVWPAVGPTRVVVADEDGIWVDTGSGHTLAYDDGGAEVISLATADDDTLFAATQDQRLLRSDDGGATWSDLGVQLDAPPDTLTPRPDFGTWGELLVGTYDGSFVVREDGSVERWMAFQRVDDQTDWVRCEGCTAMNSPAAALGMVSRMPVGATAVTHVRGSTVRVVGGASRRSNGELWVDGVRVGRFRLVRLAVPSTVIEVSGLDDTMHRVEVVVTGGGELQLDAVEVIGTASPLVYGEAGPTAPPRASAGEGGVPAGCGCTGAGSAAAPAGLAAALLLLGTRRRSGRSRLAPPARPG